VITAALPGPTSAMAFATAGYGLTLAAVAGTAAALAHTVGDRLTAAALVLELAAGIQAAASLAALVGGAQPAEPATAYGYLVASVAILPAALSAASGERSPWGAAMLAVGALAISVVALRLYAVWS
jgi:hypothetical protein